jgi:hypothetical protein
LNTSGLSVDFGRFVSLGFQPVSQAPDFDGEQWIGMLYDRDVTRVIELHVPVEPARRLTSVADPLSTSLAQAGNIDPEGEKVDATRCYDWSVRGNVPRTC